MFPNEFLASGYVIDDNIATRLVAMRNEYDYPRAYMRLSTEPTQFPLSANVWAEPIHPTQGEITDLALDKHHATLLNSSCSLDNLLGTLSTVFWGFYTFSPQFALVRARRHLNGYMTKPASTPSSVAEALRSGTAENLGTALGLLSNLSQLGRMPFGSKVIAFKHADIAGVLDNQLDKGFRRSQWAQGAAFMHAIGSVNLVKYQERYCAWCQFLCIVATRLNVGIAGGRPWHWQANESVKQEWRAIDVERAIFTFFKTAAPQAL